MGIRIGRVEIGGFDQSIPITVASLDKCFGAALWRQLFQLVPAEIGLQGLGQCLRAGKAAFVFEPLHRRHQLIGKSAMIDAVRAACRAIAQRALKQRCDRHL